VSALGQVWTHLRLWGLTHIWEALCADWVVIAVLRSSVVGLVTVSAWLINTASFLLQQPYGGLGDLADGVKAPLSPELFVVRVETPAHMSILASEALFVELGHVYYANVDSTSGGLSLPTSLAHLHKLSANSLPTMLNSQNLFY